MWEKVQIIVPIHSGSGQQGQASFPGGKEMKKGELVGGRHRPWPCCCSLCLSHAACHSVSLSISLSVRNLFLRSKIIFFFFKGKKQNPNVEGQKQQEVPSQVSDLQVTRTQTGWGFNSLQSEKNPSHLVSLQKREDFSRFRIFSSIT